MISNNDVKNITIKTEKCTSEQEDNKGVKLTCVKFDKNDFKNYSLIDSRKILNEDKKNVKNIILYGSYWTISIKLMRRFWLITRRSLILL